MSTDRGDYDHERGEKHREMLKESRERIGDEKRKSVHSDGGSPIPRNQDVQNSGNSAKNTSKDLSTSHKEKIEKHREGREGYHQDSGYSSKESSIRSHSERSSQHLPEKRGKLKSFESTEERHKQRERSKEHRYSIEEGLHSSSDSRKRSHSERSTQHLSEKLRKMSETTDLEAGDDEKREKRDKNEERRYSEKESPHSSSKSRKRSHSPSSSDGKSSDTRRFKIPKKEHKSDDLRDKLEKKPDRREAERSSTEMPKSSSRKERPITSSALRKEIKDLLRTEHHHLMNRGKADSNGDIQGVEWCYKYLDPSIRGHITGGRAILHHRCRQCNRICLHLLGKYGTGKRMCLTCASMEMGWREKEVPSWYYHDEQECSNCRKTRYDRPSSGSYYNYRRY